MIECLTRRIRGLQGDLTKLMKLTVLAPGVARFDEVNNMMKFYDHNL